MMISQSTRPKLYTSIFSSMLLLSSTSGAIHSTLPGASSSSITFFLLRLI